MNCTKSDGEIGKFLSQKLVGEPGKIGRTAKIGPILAVRVNEPLRPKKKFNKIDTWTARFFSGVSDTISESSMEDSRITGPSFRFPLDQLGTEVRGVLRSL
jgi:hypothetical protein